MRHAKASGPDEEQLLEPIGKAQALEVGYALRNTPMDVIHHSPYPRTEQTAAIVKIAREGIVGLFGEAVISEPKSSPVALKAVEHMTLNYDRNYQEVRQQLKELPNEYDAIGFITHGPNLYDVLDTVLTEDGTHFPECPDFRGEIMNNAVAAVLEFPIDDWSEIGEVSPKLVALFKPEKPNELNNKPGLITRLDEVLELNAV